MNKEFAFLQTHKKEKLESNPHSAHCLLPDTKANPSQKSKSQILPTHGIVASDKLSNFATIILNVII